MVEINGYDIALTRGDSLYVRVDLSGRDLPEGTDAVFTVKKNVCSDEVLIQKRFDASDEVLSILLTPAQTNLEPGVYVWDVRLQIPLESGGYEVYTPMEYAAFAVLPAVGEDIGVDGDPGTNPDLPVLQVVIGQAMEAANAAKAAAEEASAAAAAAAVKTPYIGDNGNWFVGQTDTGVAAAGSPGEDGSTPRITFRVATGEPGTQAEVKQSGTPENPIIDLTIPRGDAGTGGEMDYYAALPAALGAASPGTANSAARGDHVHPMPTAKDVGAVVVAIGAAAPETAPALWINTDPYGAAETVATLLLEEDETGSDVHAEVGGELYGVANATANKGATKDNYDFTVL